MSAINGLQHSDYSVIYDNKTPGGVKVVNDNWQWKINADKLDFSEVSLQLARDVAAMRDAAASQMSAADRYNAALGLGNDYLSTMKNPDTNRQGFDDKQNLKMDGGHHSGSFTTVSKQGTVIGLSSMVALKGENGAAIGRNEVSVQTLQITRKDGFQLNLALEEDMRINDLEDGSLSVYYAQSGITKIYDTEGNESIIAEPSGLGTDQDDIIINLNSSEVDGGDGDDTIINLANGAAIKGGKGDDKIFVPISAEQVIADGGEGDDIIAGNSFYEGSQIILKEGDDSLVTYSMRSARIEAGDNTQVQVHSSLFKSEISSTGESFTLSAGWLGESEVSLGAGKNSVKTGLTSDSDISSGEGTTNYSSRTVWDSTYQGGSGNTYFTAKNFMGSSFTGGSGNDVFMADFVYGSNIDGGGGNDLIVARRMYESSINGGDGDDIIVVYNARGSKIYGGSGNDTILAMGVEGTSIKGGEGKNTIITSRTLADASSANTAMHRWYWNGNNWIDKYLHDGSVETAYARYNQAAQELLARADEFDAQAEARFQKDKSIFESKSAEKSGFKSFADNDFTGLRTKAKAMQYSGIVGRHFMSDFFSPK